MTKIIDWWTNHAFSHFLLPMPLFLGWIVSGFLGFPEIACWMIYADTGLVCFWFAHMLFFMCVLEKDPFMPSEFLENQQLWNRAVHSFWIWTIRGYRRLWIKKKLAAGKYRLFQIDYYGDEIHIREIPNTSGANDAHAAESIVRDRASSVLQRGQDGSDGR